MLINMSHPRHSQGFTLLEIIIVASIMSLAVIMLGNWVSQSFRTYEYAQLQTTASAGLTTVLDRTSRVLRGVTGIVSAGSNSLTVYAYFSPADAVVDQVSYTATGNDFEVSVIPPTGTAPNYTYNVANQKTTVLTNWLVNVPNPAFVYYDDQGNKLTGAFATSQVKQISIYLSTNPNPIILKTSVSSQTTVTLRNMKTNL